MKRILYTYQSWLARGRIGVFLVFCCLFSLSVRATVHSYPTASVLRDGVFVKIRVSENGIYALSYDQIKKMGIAPEKVCLYGYGGALLTQDFRSRDSKIDDLPVVPFYMHKGADGVFNSGDYILFYGQGSVTWRRSDSLFTHVRNPYSDYGYYFVSENADKQKNISIKSAPIFSNDKVMEITTFTDFQLYEQELVNLLDPSSGVNGGGRVFFGEKLNAQNTSFFCRLNSPNALFNARAHLRFEVATNSKETAHIEVSIGNIKKDVIVAANTGEQARMATNAILTHAFIPHSEAIDFSMRYTNATGNVWLNYVELNNTRRLAMDGSFMGFRSVRGVGKDSIQHFYLSNAKPTVQVWDITHKDSICRVDAAFSGTTLSFYGSATTQREYVAVDVTADKWLTPTIIGKISNQNLHALRNINMLIVTPKEFMTQAKMLAALHEQYDGLTTAVVTDEQIYNEFSSGTPDATAIRWCAKMLYDTPTTDSLQYLLLFGDGTYDNRKIISISGDNNLLTYQINDNEPRNYLYETYAIPIDDYFGCLDDSDGIAALSDIYHDDCATMNIAVGRLPISTKQEADDIVEKIRNYLGNCDVGDWKTQLVFLADDGDNGLHTQMTDNIAENIRINNPNFIVNKLYLDAHNQEVNAAIETYPIVREKLNNFLKNGVFFFDYCGHGGYNNITSENIFSIADINQMTNARCGLWMLATCSFAHFDAGRRSAAESAILLPNGGAIGVVSACRTVFASENDKINQNFCKNIFAKNADGTIGMPIGEALRRAKNACGREHNKLAYLLLGDPALTLKYPTEYSVMAQTKDDTLRALSLNHFEGKILKNNRVANEFNGRVVVRIFDKLQTRTTQDNDQKDGHKKKYIDFSDYTNLLYKNTISVKKGEFQFAFRVPKDIRYNFDYGHLVFYAYDTTQCADGIGNNDGLVIGGSDPNSPTDTLGPNLKVYLNHEAFKNGDKTHEKPTFYAKMSDMNGINFVGSDIGHTPQIVLDNDPAQVYFPSVDNYQEIDAEEGIITYPFTALEDGEHTLFFRVWDLANNSSTASLNFKIVKGYVWKDFSVLVFPNPLITKEIITFRLQTEQAEDVSDMELYLYNFSGKMVAKARRADYGDISLNVKDIALSSGIYIFLLKFSLNGVKISQNGKIIVK